MNQADVCTGAPATPRATPTMVQLRAALRRLVSAHRRSTANSLLAGLHVGFVGHPGAAPGTRQLVESSLELDAHAALLDAGIVADPAADGERDAAHLLGQRDAGLDCTVANIAQVAELARRSGLPVRALIRPGSVCAVMLDHLGAGSDGILPTEANRHSVLLQAGLLEFFGERK